MITLVTFYLLLLRFAVIQPLANASLPSLRDLWWRPCRKPPEGAPSFPVYPVFVCTLLGAGFSAWRQTVRMLAAPSAGATAAATPRTLHAGAAAVLCPVGRGAMMLQVAGAAAAAVLLRERERDQGRIEGALIGHRL